MHAARQPWSWLIFDVGQKRMLSIPQEAARELFLLSAGVRTTGEVVSWADSVIEREAEHPEALIELSTTPVDRVDRFIELLSLLRERVDYWPGVRDGLSEAYFHVKRNPGDAERIGVRLWTASSFLGSDLPPDLRFFYRFEDAFTLAQEEHYGTIQSVTEELLSELSLFEKRPNKAPEPTPGAVTPRATEGTSK